MIYHKILYSSRTYGKRFVTEIKRHGYTLGHGVTLLRTWRYVLLGHGVTLLRTWRHVLLGHGVT